MGKGRQAVKGSEHGDNLGWVQLGGMSQCRGAWKGEIKAKPTAVLSKYANDVVLAIIRQQNDENLGKVSCVPQGRLDCRDTMQKNPLQDSLVLWI